MSVDLVAIGEGMVEFHAQMPGRNADLFRRGFAGDVVNTLIHAARLGVSTALVSRIGDDAFGPQLRAAWAEEGIDLSHAPTVPGENGVYFVLTDDRGEREFLYRRAGSAASGLSPDDLDLPWLGGARMILLSGITQAISATAEATVAAAAALGRPAAYDPNYRPRLWARRGGLVAARAALVAVAPRVDWILPSYPADLPLIGAEGADPRDALAAFADFGPDVAMKMGADGVMLRHGGATAHVPAVPVESVIDTTGAGDAWNAAFLAGLLSGATPVSAAADANLHAAGTLGHRGAIPPR